MMRIHRQDRVKLLRESTPGCGQRQSWTRHCPRCGRWLRKQDPHATLGLFLRMAEWISARHYEGGTIMDLQRGCEEEE